LHCNNIEDTTLEHILDSYIRNHSNTKQLDLVEIPEESENPTELEQHQSRALHPECAECVRIENLPEELACLLEYWNELTTKKREAILLILMSEEVETEIIPR